MSGGDGRAADRLLTLVYNELHELAEGYMRREHTDHTLQPTALVHEAYLKLVDQSRPGLAPPGTQHRSIGVMDEQYKRAKKQFLEVCDLDPGERDSVLDRQCADDPELRAEVDSLLHHQDDATSTLEVEIGVPLERDGAPPRRIGPYRVIREIGRGAGRLRLPRHGEGQF